MKSIQLKTAIPGPKSQALMQRREQAISVAPFHSTPVFLARAEGAMVEDVDGNMLLDFAGGIGSLNTGHRAPQVVSAVKAQADRFLHTSFNVVAYESYVAVCERLNALAPGNFPKKSMLVTTGAEAVENAIKVARAYTKRKGIICFEDAFHGRTYMAMTLTSKTHPYKAGFDPFAPEVYRVPYAYCYRCSYGKQYPGCGAYCAHHLEDTFKRVVAAENVAAIIAEPVIGEGGFIAPPREFFTELISICRKHGILFIADEVQSGFGRTGKMFACEHYGIEPDVITSAKSLGGGMPIAAITGRAEVIDAPGVGGLGGTFAGNPLSCEAALAVMDLFEREPLLANANHIGEVFQQRAAQWKSRFSIVGDVRGLGAMQAIELVKDPATKEPAKDEANAVMEYCWRNGLITIGAGSYGNILRLLMPLTITDAQLNEGLDVMEAGLAHVAANAGKSQLATV